MQETLPPLLGRLAKLLLGLRETGKAAFDLSPVNGATILAWPGAARFMAVEATAAVETIMEEAIVFYGASFAANT